MKPIKFNFYKQLIPISLFLIAALFIWVDGPLISVHGYAPLQDIEKRVDLIGLFFLWLLLKIFYFDTHTEKKVKQEPVNEDIQKKLTYLKGRFQGAIKFLKSTVIHKHGKNVNLVRLPWYLVIGPTASGKTTLLANSDVKYILAKQFKSENIKSIPLSDACNWWVTRDIVLVDVPGSYLFSKSKNMPQALAAFPYLWQSLLTLCQRIRNQNRLQGVIVTLHLPELMLQTNQQKKNEIVLDLKKRLNDMLDAFGHSMPVHLVITKCDLLPGFAEFFGETSSDEAAQAWGVTLPPCQQNENPLTVFVQRFNALIKRLNKQLIWHLHQERNVDARSTIKDFPLQIERLKESIVQMLKAIDIPHLSLSSVHLTSGTQYHVDEPTTALSTAKTYFTTHPAGIMSLPEMPPRAYFIRQFILHHLLAMPARPDDVIRKSALWHKRLAYGLAVSAFSVAALILTHDFHRGLQQAYAVKKELAQYQLSISAAKDQSDQLMQALPLLNSLQQAATGEADKLSLAFYASKSKITAIAAYHQALQTILLPQVKAYFENALQSAKDKNPEQVYQLLKAYLMLGSAVHFDANSMNDISQQILPETADKATVGALTDHIQAALQAGLLPSLDNELIVKTRKQLTALSNSALAFVILKNMSNNNLDDAIDLGTLLGSPPVLVSKGVATFVPAMFTAKKFDSIVSDEINTAAAEALQGNWVLDTRAAADQAAVNTLAGQLHTQYIANYVDIWESLLANIQLSTPKNLIELDKMIAIFTGSNSPLLRLLDTIKINTALEPITAASPKLQSLNLLLVGGNTQPNPLYGIFMSLQELHSYLQTMLSAQDMNLAISQATLQHMKNTGDDPITHIHTIAEQSPEPMKAWLNMISTKSWDFMLDATS